MKTHAQAISKENIQAALEKAAKRQNRKNFKCAEKFNMVFKPVNYKTVCPNFKVRAGVFAGSNWSFNTGTLYADSYNWWPMLMIIKGKLVRNEMNYSQSTSGHQGKLDDCLMALGIKPEVTLSVRASLKNLDKVRDELLSRWAMAEVKAKYARTNRANHMTKQLTEAEKIGLKFSKKAKIEALKIAETDRRLRLSLKRLRKAEKAKPILELVRA